MIFADTNFFLCFLREDIVAQAKEASELFETASHGKVRLLTSTVVSMDYAT